MEKTLLKLRNDLRIVIRNLLLRNQLFFSGLQNLKVFVQTQMILNPLGAQMRLLHREIIKKLKYHLEHP